MMTDGRFLLPIMVFVSYLWLPDVYFGNCTWMHFRGCVGNNKVQCRAILVSINTGYFSFLSQNCRAPSLHAVSVASTHNLIRLKSSPALITDEKLHTLINDNTLVYSILLSAANLSWFKCWIFKFSSRVNLFCGARTGTVLSITT